MMRNSDSPVGARSWTATESMRAMGGASVRRRARNVSSCGDEPSISMVTPSVLLPMKPASCVSWASRKTKGRKPTPCTTPRTRISWRFRCCTGFSGKRQPPSLFWISLEHGRWPGSRAAGMIRNHGWVYPGRCTMSRSVRTMAYIALILAAASGVSQTAARFQFTEKPGPETVGLKVVHQYDYSRTWHSTVDELGQPYTGERARPLQTLIWYPAEKSTGAAMTVRDYSELRVTETDFAAKPKASEIPPGDEGRKAALDDHLWAYRDAPLKGGHFPVVIYAPSFSNTPWENADLCEFLASYGYVVLASPDMGATTRDMTGDLAGIDAQARDISFLIGYASTLADTDMTEIAVGGFSWGGISNLFAASRDSRIKALFALDGSMRYFPGLIKQSGYARPDQMRVPLLFFTQGDVSLEEQEGMLNDPDRMSGKNALNAWTHGDLITVRMLGLTHGEFSSMFQRDENFWKGSAKYMKADYTRADGTTGYAWVARYAGRFLDAYLKQDASAMEWLKKTPGENGAPAHFLTASYRAGSG